MFKIDAPGATVADEFTEGNPGLGTPATQVSADWLNAVQRELVAILTTAGITPDKENDAQVMAALAALFLAKSGGTLTGFLSLHANPTDDAHAANKAYVDSNVVTTPDASTTTKGKVELATDSEAQAGTDTARALTPANLASVIATTTRKGIVELLDATEFDAGTDATRALTASLFTKSIAASGYIKLPGGLIMQWGTTGSIGASGGTEIVTLPIAFPTVNLGAFENQNASPTVTQASNSVSAKTLTTITVRNGGGTTSTFSWIAIGY